MELKLDFKKWSYKLISIIVICVLAILVLYSFLSFLQELSIRDKNYLLLSSNSLHVFILVTFCLFSILIAIAVTMKKIKKVTYKGLFNLKKSKIILTILFVIYFLFFIIMIFNYNVVYENRFVSYSIISFKGKTYSYSEIKEVNVYITHAMYNNYILNYVIVFNDSKTIEIMKGVTDTKKGYTNYQAELIVDDKIRKSGIIKNVSTKYLNEYINGDIINKQYEDRIRKLLEM